MYHMTNRQRNKTGGLLVEQLQSINEIAQQLHISETTARRYSNTFTEFLHGVDTGKGKKYPGQAVLVIKTIYELYQAGRSKEEIISSLKAKFKQIIDIKAPEDQAEILPINQVNTLVNLNNKLMQENTAALKQIAEILTRVLDQGEEIQELKKELQELKEQRQPSFIKRIFKR